MSHKTANSDVKYRPLLGGGLVIDETLITGILGLVAVVTIVLFSDVMSWGLDTMSDCFEANFDSSCYSASTNQPIETEDPMWWPHD